MAVARPYCCTYSGFARQKFWHPPTWSCNATCKRRMCRSIHIKLCYRMAVVMDRHMEIVHVIYCSPRHVARQPGGEAALSERYTITDLAMGMYHNVTCTLRDESRLAEPTSKSQHRMTGLGAGCFSFRGGPSNSRPCSRAAGCRGFKALCRCSIRSSRRNVPK